ncbi:hypothetical protein PLANPX_5925 [Lacipirellula parvula]|uniref:Uncharacterized protein n=1 Tax=Lacipirellula parvula TaxID=2650471 RepID=A0A5K7XNB7_9BACT|nr:hypothetical protein PLANPX_5925 [Lacipirellula parvula]
MAVGVRAGFTQLPRGRKRPLPVPTAKRPRPRLDFEPRPLAFLFGSSGRWRNVWELSGRNARLVGSGAFSTPSDRAINVSSLLR